MSKSLKQYELKINTGERKYELDGKDIGERTTSINIDINTTGLPIVTIKMEPDIILEGILLSRKLETLYCENCGHMICEFAVRYSVICPNCLEHNYNY